MQTDWKHLRKTARKAGLLYLIFGLTSAYGLMFFPNYSLLGGNSETTVNSILNNEFLFRTKIFSQLVSATLFIFLGLVLKRLFNEIDPNAAQLMLIFIVIQVPITYILELFDVAALMIIKGELLQSMDSANSRDIAILYLKSRNYGILLLEVFWGLWLIPLGKLVYKSGFIPRVIGVLLLLGGAAYIIEVTVAVLFPAFRSLVNKGTIFFYFAAEFFTILWLLLFGIRIPKAEKT